MSKKRATGLVEKHELPYGFGHAAIIADSLGDGSPIYSIELYRRADAEVERVRVYDRLKDARKHLMDIHAGACYLLHLERRPDPDEEARKPGTIQAYLGNAPSPEILP